MRIKLMSVFLGIAVLLGTAGCKAQEEAQSVVTVSGVGTVLTRPDMVEMNVSLSKIALTTRQAQEEVSAMVRQTLQILTEAGIEDKNINTASLMFSSEYEWEVNRRILIGQKAEQIISFSIKDISGGSEKVSAIIDRLVQINGIELNQMSFGVENNTELFARSRELAYQKALDKAAQYANLSGLAIKKTLRISEEGIPQLLPASNRGLNNQFMAEDAAAIEAAAGSTVLPAGEMEITSRIVVEFLLQ